VCREDVSRMLRGCHERSAPVEFELHRSWTCHETTVVNFGISCNFVCGLSSIRDACRARVWKRNGSSNNFQLQLSTVYTSHFSTFCQQFLFPVLCRWRNMQRNSLIASVHTTLINVLIDDHYVPIKHWKLV